MTINKTKLYEINCALCIRQKRINLINLSNCRNVYSELKHLNEQPFHCQKQCLKQSVQKFYHLNFG